MSEERIRIVSGTPYDGFLAAEISQLENVQPSKDELIRLGRLMRLMHSLEAQAPSVIMSLEMAACDLAIAWGPAIRNLIDVDQVVGELLALTKPIVGLRRNRRLADLIVLRDDVESLLHTIGSADALLHGQHGLDQLLQTLGKRLHGEVDLEMSASAFDPWSLPSPAKAVPDIMVWIVEHEDAALHEWWYPAILPLAIQPTGREHRTTLDKWEAWTVSVKLTKSARLRIPQSIQRRLQLLWAFEVAGMGHDPRNHPRDAHPPR